MSESTSLRIFATFLLDFFGLRIFLFPVFVDFILTTMRELGEVGNHDKRPDLHSQLADVFLDLLCKILEH